MLRNLRYATFVLAAGLGASEALAQRTDGTASGVGGMEHRPGSSAGGLGGMEARPSGPADAAMGDTPSKKTRGIRPAAPAPAAASAPPPPPPPPAAKDGTAVKK